MNSKLLRATSTLFLAASILPAAMLHAAPQAGDNTARHVLLKADDLDGKTTRLDVVMVSPLKRAIEIDGLTCRIAHTFDKKNNSRGGSILVVIPSDNADSFDKRFGTAIDRQDPRDRRERRTEGPETRPLSGKVRILEKSRLVIIDWDGKCGDKIDKHIENLRKNARLIDDADDAPGRKPVKPGENGPKAG